MPQSVGTPANIKKLINQFVDAIADSGKRIGNQAKKDGNVGSVSGTFEMDATYAFDKDGNLNLLGEVSTVIPPTTEASLDSKLGRTWESMGDGVLKIKLEMSIKSREITD